MNIEVVAKDTTDFLTPFLPYLIIAGEKAAGEVGKKFSEKSWNFANILWKRLRPKLDEKEASREAADELAKVPEDQDAQGAFRLQLKKLLGSDEAFTIELQNLLNEIKSDPDSASYFQKATGSYIAQAQDSSTATININTLKDT